MQPLSYAARLSTLPLLALLGLLSLESSVLAATVAGHLAPSAALAAHAAVLMAFACARQAFADDLAFYFLALMLAACAGPLGAAGVLALYLLLARTRVSPNDLETWYREISGVTEGNPAVALYDKIVDGRARRPGHHDQQNFASVLGGPLAPQQALLGLIGLAYHPDYRALLGQALQSAEPSIRVHAAAVSVKLRTRARLDFQRLAEPGSAAGSPDELAAEATRLVRIAEGGFLDEANALTAREAAVGLCRTALALAPNHDASASLLCRLLADLRHWEDVLTEHAAATAPAQAIAAPVAQSLMNLRRTRELHDLLKRLAHPVTTSNLGGIRHAP